MDNIYFYLDSNLEAGNMFEGRDNLLIHVAHSEPHTLTEVPISILNAESI